jgi:hypothetical protein
LFEGLFGRLVLELKPVGVCIRPMRLRPMWPMYGTYIATLLGLAQLMENHSSNKTPVKYSPYFFYRVSFKSLFGRVVNLI